MNFMMMNFMLLFPLLMFALLVLVVLVGVLIIRRRHQHELVCQQAREKMQAFRAAGVERTQMMDFSHLRTSSDLRINSK